ncbi:hypothetical protein LRP49_07835 [Enterovibrio sp. ZSDZ35]|uniref:Uncharacterized protein n=1 Tax=Enterovibrio qingdaonensis TaxID=2899818 RepID=A0ABT5QKB8_9GAMM|nr:hypothetical protein [Enterovibrio sp. ZSDZ35]MDD1781113.1 hypothetical protein [Enterovibrio sp. ZSDZ35]
MKVSLAQSTFAVMTSLALGGNALANQNLTDLTNNDPFFYTSDQNIAADNNLKVLLGVGRPNRTHSQIPHLPVYMGYMNTNSTYRFVNIMEQVFTMVGEGKHGLWRVHESGNVRLYRRRGAEGLLADSDLYAEDSVRQIGNQYGYYLEDESWSGYKYPDQKLSESGHLNYIDLPISHPIFNGKYVNHEPIDLSNWYCTMSANDYPYAKKAMDFAFSQDGANQIGPLGKRAGLDVTENYLNVLRLDHFPDANTWINTGQEGKDASHVEWKAIDPSKTKVEYYLVERTFFNKPYLFVTAVYDNVNNDDHQYVRPDGDYYASLSDPSTLKNKVTMTPRFNLLGGGEGQAIGLPIYGVHHPNRAVFGAGGACPLKGGDWGRYPDTSGGAGWPTQYEEVTPLCDAVLVDIKFFTNLDGRPWTDDSKYLANAGFGTETVTYKMQPGEYGVFTDPYNTSRGIKNPDSQQVPEQLTLTYSAVPEPVGYNEPPKGNAMLGMIPSEQSTCRPVITQ